MPVGGMSQEEPTAEQDQAEVAQVSQALVKEASQELSALLYDYAESCWNISDLEARLAEARKKRADLLKANPWLGNVQGILNKEAHKVAKKASVPAADPEVPSDHMEVEAEAHEQKGMMELIPRIKKNPPRKIQADKTPEAVRARVLKRSSKLDELSSSSKKQFGPDHPARQ